MAASATCTVKSLPRVATSAAYRACRGYLVLPAFGRGQPKPRTIGFSFLFNGFDPHKRNYDIKNLQDKLVTLIDQALTDPVPLGG